MTGGTKAVAEAVDWHLRKGRIEELLGDRIKFALSKPSVFSVSQGIDFLGCRNFPDYILVRKSTASRVKRRVATIRRQIAEGTVKWRRRRAR